jgi:ankyrin repeat protein
LKSCIDVLSDPSVRLLLPAAQRVEIVAFEPHVEHVNDSLRAFVESDGLTAMAGASHVVVVQLRGMLQPPLDWFEALDCGTASSIDRLIAAHGSDILAARDAFGRTALHIAAARGDPDIFRGLLRLCRVSLAARDACGNTCLMTAVVSRHLPLVDLIVNHVTAAWRATRYSAY